MTTQTIHTRFAVFEGTVAAGQEDAFFHDVETRLVPVWRLMPHALALRVTRHVGRDPGSPPIAMVMEIDYPSLEAITEALASPVRAQSRDIGQQVLQRFDGKIYHFVARRVAG